MPTYDLRHVETTDFQRHDVLGQRIRQAPLRHVGIAIESRDRTIASRGALRANATHMAPPLKTSEMSVSCMGRLDDLDDLDHRDLDTWIDRECQSLANLAREDQYWVHPAVMVSIDRVSGRVRNRRFSCVGFVHECYREAIGIALVDDDQLPPTDRSTLAQIWGESVVQRGPEFGLEGEGPWPVLLPAHILHALDRDDPRDSAYQPGPDDWDYPRPR